MERQIFINEMQARFNLRKPRSEKPTNLYLVCRINNKQVKLSTGVKIYPDSSDLCKKSADFECLQDCESCETTEQSVSLFAIQQGGIL